MIWEVTTVENSEVVGTERVVADFMKVMEGVLLFIDFPKGEGELSAEQAERSVILPPGRIVQAFSRIGWLSVCAVESEPVYGKVQQAKRRRSGY